MMNLNKLSRWKYSIVVVLLLLGLLWVVVNRDNGEVQGERRGRSAQASPVKVAPVERGKIELKRSFTGSLKTQSEYLVSPKVSGRVNSIHVDISDPVAHGQLIATLDDDEFVQAVEQARAELAVEEARLQEARSALEIAARAYQRSERLRERGVASEAEFDSAQTQRLAAASQLQVAEAQVSRARASLKTAEIRLGYTRITADWEDEDRVRYVAERYVDQGQAVGANTELLRIVDLNPLMGIIFVTERDYGKLKRGQRVEVVADAFPGELFYGEIARISPVFRENSRQARVELVLENKDLKLNPGMFIQVSVVLETVEEATLVPDLAITSRDDVTGIFVVEEETMKVRWKPVSLGIRSGEVVQILDDQLTGRVVTLGQQLVNDGSTITIPENR